MQSRQECPLCRKPCNISSAIPNVLLKSIVQKLYIRCKNSDEGCDGVVTLEKLDKHEANCPSIRMKGLLLENAMLRERLNSRISQPTLRTGFAVVDEDHRPKTESVSFLFFYCILFKLFPGIH